MTAITGFLLVGAVSCSTTITSVPSPVALPATFSESGTYPLLDKWWLSFNDPILNNLIERAISDNLNLRIVWDRLAQTEAVARKAGAPLWPSLDGQAAASRTVHRQPGEGSAQDDRNTSRQTNLILGLAASYELDLWGRIRSAQEAAVLDVQSTQAELCAAAITLSAEVAAVWYALVEQYGQIDLLHRQLLTNENVLYLITLRFRQGQAGAADVLQQRQLVESRRGDIAAAEARAAVREHQLSILIGQEPGGYVAEHVIDLLEPPELPETGLPASLIQNRPDIRQAYYNILAADRRVAVAIADRFPRVGISAQSSTSAQTTSDLFNNWMASLIADLVAPLFDAGERKSEVERTRAVLSEQVHGYGQKILVSLGEVEDALIQEQKQRELIASLENQLTLSRQIIERIRDTYTKGVVDYLRVLDALLTQQSLQRTHLEARRVLLDYRIALCRALGGGWTLDPPPLARLEAKKETHP